MTWRPAKRARTDGFTLLEVIVALIIAGMAAVALFAAVGTGLHASQTASMYDQAIVRAKSHLSAVTDGTKLTPGDQHGDDGGGFQWRARVAPLSNAAVRPTGIPGRQTFPVVLYQITVWVGWSEGGTERQVRLDTEQVGS